MLTLEPFDTDLVEEVDVDFAEAPVRRRSRRPGRYGAGRPADRPRSAGPIEDGTIDLGALAAEFLALGLDPYPRKPGAEFAPISDPQDATERPFDVLKKLTDQS